MPENITSSAKQLPDEIRQKALDSLYFVGTAFLGFNKLTPHLHYEMARVVEYAAVQKRLLGIVPRNHYKTTIWSIAYPVWRALRNPNDCGLIIMNSATNAQRIVGYIRSAFESAPFIRQFFPELNPAKSKRWNKEEACLPRSENRDVATWTAAGWDSKVTSGHWDYIVFDDLVDEETYESTELMAKLTDRFEQREGLLRPPIHEREIMVVGNHWSYIDLHTYILKNHPEYFVYYRQAVEDGKPIFPEMYSMEWLIRKQLADPYVFATQWMNNPADQQLSELKKSWLLEYKRKETGVELPDGEFVPFTMMNIYGAIDPRHHLSTKRSEKLTSRNAVVVAGIDHKSRRYLLEEWASRGDPVALLAQVLDMWKRWRPHGLLKIGVESFGFQGALAPLANELWKAETYKPVLELLPRDTTRSKEARIRGGTQFFRKGLAYIHRSHVCFKEEYTIFPSPGSKDVLDAWSWCQHMMHPSTLDAEPAEAPYRDAQYYNRLVSGARI